MSRPKDYEWECQHPDCTHGAIAWLSRGPMERLALCSLHRRRYHEASKNEAARVDRERTPRTLIGKNA